jgi:ADP-ribose pyrophosphatase YjhB (NUDIX family)
MCSIKITTACGIYFNDSLLIIKEKQDDRDVLDIPAGGLHANEGILDCVKREVLEETGVTLQNPLLKAVFQIDGPDQTTINFLFTEVLHEEPTLNSSKSMIDEDISDVMFLSMKEIRRELSTEPEIFEHALARKRLEILLAGDTPDNSLIMMVL